jgi:hypothetical protein
MKDYDTYGPVPVRLGSSVAALIDERVLEVLDVVPVPREEKTGSVDLSFASMEGEGKTTRRLDER